MKVLLISPLPPPAGGIATWTRKYKQYCEAQGLPLTIVNSALVGSRAKQINSNRNYIDEIKRTWFVLKDLKHQMKTKNPDVVHINTSCSRFGLYRDALCVGIANKVGTPIIVHCRCNIQDQLQGKLSVHVFRWIAKKAKKVLTLNESSYTYANTIVPGQVITVPNFVEKEMLHETFNINAQIQNIVFVGHVQKTKGAKEIMEAAKLLPNIHFVLVGPVQQEIAEMCCPENIAMVGDQLPEMVQKYLQNADVFLFPSYTEGFANALAEAMAFGLPVITTNVGANQEMIEDAGGIIVPVGDAKSIVEAVHQLQDPEKRRKMSAWNCEKVQRCYLIDCVMKQLFTIYKEASK